MLQNSLGFSLLEIAWYVFSYHVAFLYGILFFVHWLMEHSRSILKFYKKKINYPLEDELNGTATADHGRLKMDDFTIINWKQDHVVTVKPNSVGRFDFCS